MTLRLLALTAVAVLVPLVPFAQDAAITPVGDFHQHLFSPTAAAMLSTPTNAAKAITADDLIPLLDSAGIRRAALLSVAYMYGAPIRTVEDEQAKVRAENDWTAAEALRYPDRLRAVCSVNPLKPYALEEIAYCARQPGLRHGLKLHFGNSDVRTEIPEQLEQLKTVFKAANDARMAIVVHMHANINNRRPYGVEQGRIFLEQLIPQAPDVTIQIAHLAGAGGAADVEADNVVGIFADAIAKNDPRMKNVWFDLTSVADSRITPEQAERVVQRIRQLGTARFVYGSDGAVTPAATPLNGLNYYWKLPLTEAEFRAIASNVPPYMR